MKKHIIVGLAVCIIIFGIIIVTYSMGAFPRVNSKNSSQKGSSQTTLQLSSSKTKSGDSSKDLTATMSQLTEAGRKAKIASQDNKPIAYVNNAPIFKVDVEYKRFEVILESFVSSANAKIDTNNDKQLLNLVIEDKVAEIEAGKKGITYSLEDAIKELKESKEQVNAMSSGSTGYKQNKTIWDLETAFMDGWQLSSEQFIDISARYQRLFIMKDKLMRKYYNELSAEKLDKATLEVRYNNYLPELIKKANVKYIQ